MRHITAATRGRPTGPAGKTLSDQGGDLPGRRQQAPGEYEAEGRGEEGRLIRQRREVRRQPRERCPRTAVNFIMEASMDDTPPGSL